MRLYLDEDTSNRRLVAALRSRGIDVASSLELGMNGSKDEDQLLFAATQGRILVTGNGRDFMAIHSRWMAAGKSHAGLLIAPRDRFAIGDFVRGIIRMTSDRFETENAVFYMSGS